MTTIDIIRDLGDDPDNLCRLEQHIVLKLEKPWRLCRKSACAQLPGGLQLGDGGCRITATAESFVANCGTLSECHVVAAVFAGCDALDSCEQFASAARKVIAKAKTLVIVHNRDYVLNLLDWFRSVHVLVLHHDLRWQTVPENWRACHGTERPQLERLLGSAPAMGMDNLFIDPATVYELIPWCPKLYEVQTAMHGFLSQGDGHHMKVLMSDPPLRRSPSLILGLNMERLDGTIVVTTQAEVTPWIVNHALHYFRGVKRLEVSTWHFNALTAISNFSDVTDLSLTCNAPIPFWYLFEEVLKELHLKRLRLQCVSDVNLSAIATRWPDLQSLTLSWCSITTGEQEISPESLRNLVSLHLYLRGNDQKAHKRVMGALLEATTQLETLRLDGPVLCHLFLMRCATDSLPRLQRLTLSTDKQLPGLALTGGDLHCLVKALPSLRYAATDSYDLRLFFQHYMPAVTIDWCHCTTCAAEFPRLSDKQNNLWNTTIGHGAVRD